MAQLAWVPVRSFCGRRGCVGCAASLWAPDRRTCVRYRTVPCNPSSSMVCTVGDGRRGRRIPGGPSPHKASERVRTLCMEPIVPAIRATSKWPSALSSRLHGRARRESPRGASNLYLESKWPPRSASGGGERIFWSPRGLGGLTGGRESSKRE